MRSWIAVLMLGAAVASAEHALAAEPHGAMHEGAAISGVHSTADTFPHPHLSEDSHWAGPMAIIILAFFLAAAVIGPIVRADTPEEVPPAHSHDEPPGASHHHGSSGTHAEEPHH
jgi:hypothetical protein